MSTNESSEFKRVIQPEGKLIGFTFLIVYLGFLISCVEKEKFVVSSSSSIPVYLVGFCSFWNIVSHLAVIWNLINHVYVISILIGVGFDVFSSAVYLHFLLTQQQTLISGWLFKWLLLWLVVDLGPHLRAIFLHTSLERMDAVVTSANNNLRGVPGPYWMDHFFAFQDTAKHGIFLFVSVKSLFPWIFDYHETFLQSSGVQVVIAAIFIFVAFVFQPRASQMSSSSSNALGKSTLNLNISIPSTGESSSPRCNCPACCNRTCFAVYPNLCKLWLCTFEELLQKIDEAKKNISKPLKAS